MPRFIDNDDLEGLISKSSIRKYAEERKEEISEEKLEAILDYARTLFSALSRDGDVTDKEILTLISTVIVKALINEKELRRSLYKRLQEDIKTMNFCFGGLKMVEQYVMGRHQEYNRQITLLERLNYGPGDKCFL